MVDGTFTVEYTAGAVTPNVCNEAIITATGYNVPNAVDKAHTIASRWEKATGIPFTCDSYAITKSDPADDENKTYTFHFNCI